MSSEFIPFLAPVRYPPKDPSIEEQLFNPRRLRLFAFAHTLRNGNLDEFLAYLTRETGIYVELETRDPDCAPVACLAIGGSTPPSTPPGAFRTVLHIADADLGDECATIRATRARHLCAELLALCP